MSWRGSFDLNFARMAVAGLALLSALPVLAQYQGQLSKKDDKTPILRSVAVLEWTGDAGKPKKSRLIPLTVFDGDQLQDGGVYLARPQPLAVSGETEYELKNDGKNIGLFDVENAAQEEGMWVGYGKWLPMPKPKPVVTAPAKIDDDEGSDKPVLHRKHKSSDAGSGGSGSGSSSGSSGPPPDPDRPTLHKAPNAEDTGSSNTGSSGNGNGSGSASSSGGSDGSSSPAQDPDRPTLHKKDSSDSASSSGSGSSGPKLKKKDQKPADEGYVENLPNVSDPDRPRLKRGQSSFSGPGMTPSLLGLPPDMEQAVAVSDARNTPEHPWKFSWSNPDDEQKMKTQLEDVARTALGIATPPPPPAPKTKSKSSKTRLTLPPAPAPLADEQFRVFELAYGSGATLVLSAHTDGPPAQQKYVTLIAQPDLYGSLLVLLKNVTDGAHLDDTPRMRLVDAVDALADNRGELVFELRGSTQRQFALYRVMRGTAEKLFVTGGGEIGTVASE